MFITRKLKQIVRRSLTTEHILPVRRTSKNALLGLISQLHPVIPGLEMIRMGPDGDGGYLVPDDLTGIGACFSPGVSSISGFEKDCANAGMDVYLADCSVDGPVDSHDSFHFLKKFIGSSNYGDYITLDNWIDTCGPASKLDLMLQMDIEGFEYEVFHSVSDLTMARFRIIVVEFHRIDQLWSKSFFDIASRVFDKILQTHVCVHAHPNNNRESVTLDGVALPPLMEFTFLRKDRLNQNADQPDYQVEFPHALDRDNTPKAALPLPQTWYHDTRNTRTDNKDV